MKVKYEIGGVVKTIPFSFALDTNARRNGFSLSLMEKVFQLILANGGASANVFTNRPKSLAANVNDFIVSSMQGNIEDMAVYGECTMNIALFAKDAAGFKNSNKLSVMQDAVFDSLPLSVTVTTDLDVTVEEYLIDKNPDIVGDASDDYGFHCRMILLQTTIKVI